MDHRYKYPDGLSSERLYSRFLNKGDAKLWEEFLCDPRATEFAVNTGAVTTEDQARFWIYSQLRRYAEKRYGLQAIHHKTNDEFLGMCGLLLQELDGEQFVEVGYHFLPKHWGQGYAPEAARMFMSYAFSGITTTIISIIHPLNLRSQRVAEKNGLAFVKIAKWRNADYLIFGNSL